MRIANFFMLCLIFAAAAFAEEAVKEKKVFKAVIDKDGVQRVEIIGGEYFFEPNHIIVKVNVPVELKAMKKPGIVPHDIAIEAPDAGINFKENISKEPKVFKFTPKKTGKYPIYCSKKLLFFKSHRERGMEGVLEVIE